jgi:hypothetical protein
MFDQLLSSPDYPMIAEGLFNTPKEDMGFFVESPPISIDTFIAGAVSQSLLCNDYRKFMIQNRRRMTLLYWL